MSSITIDTDDELIGKKSKSQRYKQIVDLQARQKLANSLFRKRNNTTNERSSLSFSFKNNEPVVGERRLRQQSTFLPFLADKALKVKKSHQRSYTYGHENESDDNSFQTDAIDYLRDCETILENLKRLTKNSTQKVSSPIVQNKIKGGLSIKSSLRIQQQKNMLRSPEINQSISNRFIKNGTNEKENDQSDHSDHNDCDQSDRLGDIEMKKIWRKSKEELKQEQRQKGKTNVRLLTDNNQNNKEQIKQFEQQKSMQTKICIKNDRNKICSTTIFVSLGKYQNNQFIKGINKTQDIHMIENSASKSKKNTNGSSNFTTQVSYQQQVDQNIKDKQFQQVQVSKEINEIGRNGSNHQNKKQKFLLKFLNNANTRGMELHKKIMEHKLKNRAFIHCVSNKCGKNKELIENITKEQNKKSTQLKQNECQNKKIMENQKQKKNLLRIREYEIISNAKIQNFPSKIFTQNKYDVETLEILEPQSKQKNQNKQTNAVIIANRQSNQAQENKEQGQNNKENKQNRFEKASDDEEQDCKDDDSDKDGEEESQQFQEQQKNNKILNLQKELKQSIS